MSPVTRAPSRMIKLVFAGAAFVSVISGLAIYLLAEEIGLDPATAKIIAAAFLLTGLADYLLLRFWDRIFKRGGGSE